MGWPRKNDDGLRLYRERDGSYLLVQTDCVVPSTHGPCWDAVANVYPGPSPSLVGTSVSRRHIEASWLARAQWDELPPEWREAFLEYWGRDGDPLVPERVRGFWRVGHQPLVSGLTSQG